MTRRSDKRAEYLTDILTTAVEGGINYWAAVSGYQWDVLRPATVKWADSNDVPVTRQGDMFAIEHEQVTTRLLTSLGGKIVKAGRLLGTSHCATDVVELPDGRTFARGTLTHRPEGKGWTGGTFDPRRAEHRRQKMANGKTWHLIVKNTVPTDAQGNNRAWSRVGNVD